MPLTPQEKDNLTRWDEKKRGFYEVYYLKWNDLAQGTAAWLRYTLLSPLNKNREPEVSVWAIFFDAKNPQNNCAVKKTYSLRETRIEREIFYFSAGPSAIYESGARGELSDSRTHIRWELKFQEEGQSFRHFPSPLYWGNFPKTKFLAPYLSTKISGEFVVNDRRLILDQVPAHQAHIWGTEMAPFWVWGNCNTFAEDPNFCFEGLSAKIAVGGKLSPPMTLLFFYWEGKLYRFNSVRQWFTNRSNFDFYQRQRRVEGEERFARTGRAGSSLESGEILRSPETPSKGIGSGLARPIPQPRGLGGEVGVAIPRYEATTRAPIIDRWHFESASDEIQFVGDFFSEPQQMVGVRYEDPDGSERFCHNTKIADLKIKILKKNKAGWQSVKTLTAVKSAAFEVVQPTLDHRVKLLIP